MRLTDALRLIVGTFDCCGMGWKTWRRPTLPCLETQYHGRWGFSRPSSGWDRVRAPRDNHQVVQPIQLPRVSCRGAVCQEAVVIDQLSVVGRTTRARDPERTGGGGSGACPRAAWPGRFVVCA